MNINLKSTRLRWNLVSVSLGLLIGYVSYCSWYRTESLNPLQFVRRPAGVQTRDDAALLSGWLDQVENGFEVGKNHQRVRSAFSQVVADARRSTVRVTDGQNRIALGTIVAADGYIVTKASELAEVKALMCQLSDHRRRKARIVATLPQQDLALLKINASGLHVAPMKRDTVPAVGSLVASAALTAEPLAVGIVSVEPHRVDNDAVLGIRLRDADSGVEVVQVIPDSAAEQGGLFDGDRILALNGRSLDSSEQLVRSISHKLPGDEVRLTVRREEDPMEVVVQLGRRTDLDMENSEFQGFLGGELSFRRTGFPSVLQHDTFLLPEHCGGPLVDLDGNVVGVNIARAERVASYALPVGSFLPWVNRTIENDRGPAVASVRN